MSDPPAPPTADAPARDPTGGPADAPTGARPIHPEVDWQAAVLATKVLRRVMSLADACQELAGWQADALGSTGAPGGTGDWRAVEPRALIVTHMMNRLLDRGY